jgi:hypothetical protein
VNTEFNVWYLDDGSLGDKPETVLRAVQKLVEDFRAVGLEVNQGKCELIILNHSREEELETEEMFRGVLPTLKVVPAHKSLLLGAPLHEEGVSAVIREKREGLERMVERLKLIDSHQAFTLLKNCFALPKLQYVLRASPAYTRVGDLERFDEVLVSALSTITNVSFERESLEQAVLPVRLGGLGIRMSKDIALPAFISSLHSVRGLVDAVLHNVRLAGDDSLRMAVDEWRNGNAGTRTRVWAGRGLGMGLWPRPPRRGFWERRTKYPGLVYLRRRGERVACGFTLFLQMLLEHF